MINNMDHVRNTQKYNSITNSTFHENFPDDHPAGSKHLAYVHDEKNNTITLVYSLGIFCVDPCVMRSRHFNIIK